MATGRRAFQGTTAASLIGAILHTDPPPVSTLQPLTPPGLDRIVSRCLAKDPDDRWQTARDLMLELKWIAEHPTTPAPARKTTNSMRLLTTLSLVVLAIAATAIALVLFLRPRAEGPAVRLTFSPLAGLTLAEVRYAGPVTLSPDGLRVVYVASGSDRQQLWVQSLDSTTAQALAGTDDAAYPFWSPDSRSIGFFANGRLKRIDAAGGPLQVLCDAVLPRGGTWNGVGVIVFSAGAGEHLYRVSAGGGARAALTFESPNGESHWPSFLPDGRHFVYFGRREKPGIYVASLDPDVPARLLTSEIGLYAGAAYASDGYLMLARGGAMAGTLFAHPIDLHRLELTGDPVPLAERVPFYPNLGRPDFSVSKNGRLIHGNLARDSTSLVWFDRAGNPIATVPGASGYQRPVLSPDEKTIAAHRLDPETQSPDVCLIDSDSGVTSRLTTNPGLDNMGLWSPDGRHILYGSTRDDQGTNTYLKVVDGTEAETPVFTSGFRQMQQMTDWSGKLFVFGRQDPQTQWDLWTMPETGRPQTQRKRRCCICGPSSTNTTVCSRLMDDGWPIPRINRGARRCTSGHSRSTGVEEHRCRRLADGGRNGGAMERSCFTWCRTRRSWQWPSRPTSSSLRARPAHCSSCK